MNHFYKAALALVCLFGLGQIASAQTTTVTASHLKMGGYLISTGQVNITPVNITGTPIPFADGTGAQNGPTAFSCQVVNGVITGAIGETGTVSGTCTVPSSGGPYTWTWPTSVHGGITIGTIAGTCSIQVFNSFNGTSLVPESTGVINVLP